MTAAWAPLRVSFMGGGSDVPAYCDRFEGTVVSATLALGITATLGDHGPQTRPVTPLVEQALRLGGCPGERVEIRSDVPQGTGLGGSSACAVAVLLAAAAHLGVTLDPTRLAEQACRLELEVLHEPIGRQDQHASAFGGFNQMKFGADGLVRVEPMALPSSVLAAWESQLILVDTGLRRRASTVLSGQRRLLRDDPLRVDVMHRIVGLVPPTREALEQGDHEALGRLLHRGWQLKRQLAPGVSTGHIDDLYAAALDAGALGGKLLGGGGGGFLLVVVSADRRAAVSALLGNCLPVRFSSGGARVLSESAGW
jgi:D-glycero-alpha-D-manno-heptose-7-phosphate kinase